MSEPAIVVGRLPDAGMAALLPAGARVPGVVMATKKAAHGDILHLMLVDARFDARGHHASLRVWNPSARQW